MSSSTKSTLTSIITTLLCLVVVALPHAALAYDAAADFSSSSNPNGVWSYGWSATLGSAFNLTSSNTAAGYGQSGLTGWLAYQDGDVAPAVLLNSTANPIFVPGATTYQPGQLAENPGPDGQYAVVRWTAPSAGRFSITATFSGLSSAGDSTDVHVLLNGVSIFNSAVIGSPSPTSYSGIQNLAAGDHIDFAVGIGSNVHNYEDTTGLSATISEVPAQIVGDDAAADFSLGSNPNGVWSYGWSVSVGSAFILDTNTTTVAYGQPGLDGWLSGLSPEGIPSVLYNSNPTADVVAIHITFQPGQLALNPNNGNYALVRWTAPSTGQFSITATFSGLSSVGDSADVHVLLNGVSIFNSAVIGSPSPVNYSGLQNLANGDHIDFAVGFGPNGNDHDDVTALAATIGKVPGEIVTNVCQPVAAAASAGVIFGNVTAGQAYVYSATGCIQRSVEPNFADPDGNQYLNGCTQFVKNESAPTGSTCPGLSLFSLVGKINGTSCFQLGKSGTFTALASGQLVLYCNDNNYSDNSGSWDVCVGVQPEVISLTCPSDITVSTDSGQCSAVVTYPAPVVTPTNATVVCDPPSGATFPEGTNTVDCVATGASGDTNCSFTVTVEDREAPRVACRPAPNPSAKKIPASGKDGSIRNPSGYWQLLAEDNCDPNPIIYVQDMGSAFRAGPFASGDIVKLTRNGGTPSSSPGNPPIVADIHLNGDGLEIAVDADGNETAAADGCRMVK